MIITIDGPAGSGKTTVARRVAECLHFPYFDTGAIYRAITLSVIRKGILPNQEEEITRYLREEFSFAIKGEKGAKRYFLGKEEVTKEIRSEEVNTHVSEVSAHRPVREYVWKMQKGFASREKNAVFEGRDMGSVVFPEAELKIFLTARPEIRAMRRAEEIKFEEGKSMELSEMLKEILRRDEYDSSRKIAPLKCAEDAVVIDTSQFSIDEVVEQILEYKAGLEK